MKAPPGPRRSGLQLQKDERVNETHLFRELDMDDVAVRRLTTGEAVCFSHRSPDKHTPNEDAIALLSCGPDRSVLIVADGLGGMPNGGAASSLAVERLEQAVRKAPADGPSLRAAILDGLEAANRALLEDDSTGATTIVVVEFGGGRVRSYHVGDSLALLVGQRGRVKLRTEAHSPVGYAISAGILDEREAMHHEERHLVSNVVGSPLMRIEIGPEVVFAGRDTLLLASDGLTDNLYEQEIVELVRKGPLDCGVRKLVKTCRERMSNPREGEPSKPDDLSVIAFRRATTPKARAKR